MGSLVKKVFGKLYRAFLEGLLKVKVLFAHKAHTLLKKVQKWLVYNLFWIARKFCSKKNLLSSSGWKQCTASTTDQNVFIVCNPASSINPYATLQRAFCTVLTGEYAWFVRMIYRVLIMSTMCQDIKHEEEIRTDVYIMF